MYSLLRTRELEYFSHDKKVLDNVCYYQVIISNHFKIKVNWGIIGLGNIAQVFSHSLLFVDNAKLLGVASRDKGRLNDFMSEYGLNEKYCFDNYNDLIECDEIDAVYIALPNNLHFEWICKCINSGKHILVEKPAVVNLNQIQIICDKIKSRNLQFHEAFMYLHHPRTLTIANLLKSGVIGEPTELETVFGIKVIEEENLLQKFKKRFTSDSRLFNKSLGGGCILDLGCYLTSFCQFVAKIKSDFNVNSVTLEKTIHDFGHKEVEIESSTELTFENGFKSRIHCSFKRDLGQRTKISGTNGEIHIESSWSCKSNKIIINNECLDTEDLKFDNPYSFQIFNISSWILQGLIEPQYPSFTLADSLDNMRILDKWRSAVSH
jgi:predicted dehydrogenase